MNKKIKILYVHHGTNKGGAPRSLAFLIDKLDKNIFEPYVLFFRDYEDNKKLFENVGAKIIYNKQMGPWHGSYVSGISLKTILLNIKYSIPTYFLTKKVIKDIKPDIIHLNSTCLFLVAKAIKKVDKSIPVICHVREPLLPGFWGNILRKNNDKYVDEYIAIEKYDAKTLYTNKKVNIIYNFVDFDTYNNRIKSSILYDECKIPKSEKIVLYIARISPENGAYEMLQNLERFIIDNKNVHFCLVGARFDITTNYLNKVLEYDKKYSNVHVISFRNDVPELIASSTVLVVPFTVPHFARSVIEAAAIGVPSIVSNVDGLEELVINNKTGIIYDIEKSEDLTNKLSIILNNKEMLKDLSKNASNFAYKNFDAVKNSQKTFAIYKKYLNK